MLIITLPVPVIFLNFFFIVSIFADEMEIELPTPQMQFVTGIDYSSGYYGLKHPTEILYLPFVFKYRQDAWDYSLTFSYIKMTGPGGVISGGDGGVIPLNNDKNKPLSKASSKQKGNSNSNSNKPMINGITTNEGLGDILFKISHALDMSLHLPFLFELGSQIKLPVADEEKELGTGKPGPDHAFCLKNINLL